MPYQTRQIQKILNRDGRGDTFDAVQFPNLAGRVAEHVIWNAVGRVENRAVLDTLDAYWRFFDVIDGGLGASSSRAARFALVDAAASRLADEVAAAGLRAARTAQVGSYYGHLWQLDVMTVPDVSVRARGIGAVGDLLREDVFDDLIKSLLGREWRLRYAAELERLTADIKIAISEGMAAGEGIDDISRRVRNALGVPTDRRRGRRGSDENRTYRSNFNRVQTLTRTVVNQASNDGAIAAYRQNSDILSGYRWLAARDEKTCPTCRALDNTFFALGEERRPPAHPNCRCTIVPEIGDPTRVTPTILTPPAQPPRYTFGEWLALYGVATQVLDFLEAA